MSDVLLETLEDGVLTLTLNRPERLNALTPEMCERLQRSLHAAAVDSAVGAIVVTGAGNAFCAGGDVKAMAESGADNAGFEARAADLRRSVVGNLRCLSGRLIVGRDGNLPESVECCEKDSRSVGGINRIEAG